MNSSEALKEIERKIYFSTTKIVLPSEEQIRKEIEATNQLGANFLYIGHRDYPEWLFSPFLPPVFSYFGNSKLLQKKIVAVSGTRHPSMNGIKFALTFSKEITNNGLVTCSGMSIGIESNVHEANVFSTIAVIGGGIDDIYSKQNHYLYNRVKQNGLILTDRPLGTQSTHYNFAKKNALIAALGSCTCIIESSIHSGAMFTAQRSFDLQKPVFAVPGHPFNPLYQGNNKLLQMGAKVLLSHEDVLENDNYLLQETVLEIQNENSILDVKLVLELIGKKDTHFGLLVDQTGMSWNKILSILAEVEIAGAITTEYTTVRRLDTVDLNVML